MTLHTDISRATDRRSTAGPRLVYSLHDGDAGMADLLGGKGANLAEMTRLGLPVPGGFVVSTDACREYLATGHSPARLVDEITAHIARLEEHTGSRFGDHLDPLLVSVRSGARFSMPGMMDTVLNVGLVDDVVEGLARRGGERFAWDCYRRLVHMYGHTVLGVDDAVFEEQLAATRRRTGARDDTELDAVALRSLTTEFRRLLVEYTGEDLPQDPREQLDRAVDAVFASWNGDRARTYRQHAGISDDLGTAVSVVQMVYGNTGPRSGSGVCFTRNPATGAPGLYGDYLANAQGEDVVNGSRTTADLVRLARQLPDAYRALQEYAGVLERRFLDMCDIEFTVEDGRLWVLQVRVGKRSAAAAFRIAVDLVDEDRIDLDEALRRVDGAQLQSLLHPTFSGTEAAEVLGHGLAASPGAASGEVVFDAATATAWAASGRDVVLVRPETSADDVAGMIAAVAVVTARGGLTSHAAVVARGLGRTCVCGVSGLEVDPGSRSGTWPVGSALREGDVVSVDGSTGRIYQGRLSVQPSDVAAALRGEVEPPGAGDPTEPAGVDWPVAVAVLRLLGHADRRRTLGVRANAETGPDAQVARTYGADGVGLCRTEHMLLGPRRVLVEQLVTDVDRAGSLDAISAITRAEMAAVLRVMDGLPVVVRLLDPPLHEFLPDLVELTASVAVASALGREDPAAVAQLDHVQRWHEANPMLGLRGVRLLTVIPELVDAQIRGLGDAIADLRAEGLDPRAEVMIPLVADVRELTLAKQRIAAAVAEVAERRSTDIELPVGVMVELPRAALTADRLASEAAFFSFGTNDLTQTTWGISRDDAETSFLAEYRRNGVVEDDPFVVLDRTGVGRLVQIAVTEGRQARPGLGLGACGESAGEPGTIHYLASLGLDYVSCSPPRVPVARLEAGRAAVEQAPVFSD
jgi:pyruvate,orthophosphate dikinase